MELLDTEYKRKSAVLTSIIMALILFLIFTFGLKYLDPPEEYGIAVNFGTSNVGSGNTQSEPAPASSEPQEQVEEVEQEQVEEVVEEVQETPTEPVSTPTKAEDVITNDNVETIKINKQKEAKRKAEEAQKRIEEAERKAEREAKLKADRIKKQKAAEKAARDAKAAKEAKEKADKRKGIDNLLGGLNKGNSKGNGTGGTGNGGDGDDNGSGDKGSLDGNPYGNSYYGSGSGSGGGYGLNGRNLTKSGQGFKQDCNEYGKVVVRIEVDKNGRVIKATPGVKGSTNTDPCLLAPAKKSAMSFRWNADSKAPTKQIGFVIVSFNK
ncbi:energy transducer TonB [Aureibaculum conchae]|uniref:energy transducer TonB n=1 Tax=Aureibaculum sp. 2308TA14-22 TaxID=3108392 RepID=UPI003394B3E6